ncbi:hypothetical protein DFAR_3320003 [Desulfarculales bacterium]
MRNSCGCWPLFPTKTPTPCCGSRPRAPAPTPIRPAVSPWATKTARKDNRPPSILESELAYNAESQSNRECEMHLNGVPICSSPLRSPIRGKSTSMARTSPRARSWSTSARWPTPSSRTAWRAPSPPTPRAHR